MFDFDKEPASRYGAFASYQTEAAPASVEYYGESPAVEMDRLLDHYTTPESQVLDIGCGAGFTLCRLAPRVTHIWGIDLSEELLRAAQLRVDSLGIKNATLLRGNSSEQEGARQLPDATFDLAFSRRGPDFSEPLLRTLRKEAFFVQELVSDFDGYPLREIFGRRQYDPSSYADQEVRLHKYARLNLFPVSCKEYFYEEYYRDPEHLASFLTQIWAMLSNWQLPPNGYVPERDRVALELYARYNMTSKGIRVLRQRKIFVLRRAIVAYYPVDNALS